MAGDEAGMGGQRHAPGLQHADDGEADGHQRRLGVLGEAQDVLRPLEHGGREAFAQGLVDLLEDGARLRIGGGEVLAHADGLAALAGKRECSAGHGGPLSQRIVTIRAGFAGSVWQSQGRRPPTPTIVRTQAKVH
jgi:hypothetical protein